MLTPYAYSKGLTLLKEFYSYTGSLNIGSGLVYKDYNLGEFLRLAIEHYQASILPDEVIDVIKSLGVDLEKPLPEKESIYYKISEEFLIGYQKAKAYYEANGDKAIPPIPLPLFLLPLYSLHPTYSLSFSSPTYPPSRQISNLPIRKCKKYNQIKERGRLLWIY